MNFGATLRLASALLGFSCTVPQSSSVEPQRPIWDRPETLTARSDPAPRVIAPAKDPVYPESKPPPPTAPVDPIYALPLPGPGLASRASATTYANLSEQQCRDELVRRELPTERVKGSAPGVATPVRITGPMHGVRFVTPGGGSKYGVVDCRMVLAMNDFAALLERLDVTRVRIDNIYRPGAHLPRSRKRSQHAYGLALDITELELRDGTRLNVSEDFHGRIGAATCGPHVGKREGRAAALSNIVCATARSGVFHDLLTPNFNAAHRSHFHFDIKRKAKSVSVK